MKKPFSVGYFSSYDRGLECLLDMWPKIREPMPEATLDIYYGWNSFDMIHKNNPEMMKWKWSIIRKLSDLRSQGVTEHGRVTHEELAKAMKEIQVWAYPTEFTEIHCITALKTAEAGMHQVTTGVAALAETAENGTIIACDDIYSNEKKQAEFITAVAEALKDPKPSKQIDNPYWTDVAKVWNDACVSA
jgi:glycosyltransferase involved in cell wall biosynthesis